MDQYPFGNFRDNPPWPLCLRNQAPVFSYEVQEPNIPRVIPPSFHPNQMDCSYVHYTAVPILLPANPFTNNFSFPPPMPTRIASPADIGPPGRPFNPLLVPNYNEYFMLQAQLHQSDLLPRQMLVGPNITDAQFSTSQIQKQRKVQDERPTLQQDQFVSEVKSTQYTDTTVPVSRDHGDVYNLQQKQNHKQQQLTQQTIQTLSDQLQQQAKLSGQLAAVKHEHSATPEMNSASTGDSATERFQTIIQHENPVIQHEEIDFPPKQSVTTRENVFLPNLRVSQTTGTVNVNKHSEINEHPGVILMQAISQEQENRSDKQQLPGIQEELIMNKKQDEQHAQSHQHNKKPVNNKQVEAQFNQDKKEDKPRLQNNIKRNKSERHNTEQHRTQPRLQHGETPHWQQNNYWPPQYSYNRTQYPYQQTDRQQLQQTHQTQKVYSSQNTAFKESPHDFYKPAYTSRFNTDIRHSRKGNQHSKDVETRCSKERTDKDPQNGINDHKVADFNHIGSRCYRNRKFTSTS